MSPKQQTIITTAPAVTTARTDQITTKFGIITICKEDEQAKIALADEQFETLYYYPHSQETAMTSHHANPTWIIDSGATRHFTGDHRDLQQFHKWEQPRSVITADGKNVQAVGCGNATVAGVLLREVWLVPAFNNTKPISVRQLSRSGYSVTFNQRDEAICRKAGNRNPVFIARIQGSLYMVGGDRALATSVTGDPPETSKREQLEETEVDLWHRRTAHTNAVVCSDFSMPHTV